MKTTLDIALIRWSVTCISWHDLSAGYHPQLLPFLLGWVAADIGLTLPPALPDWCCDSIRKGYKECEDHLAILAQREQFNDRQHQP